MNGLAFHQVINPDAMVLLGGMSRHLHAHQEAELRALAEFLAEIRCEVPSCGRGIVWFDSSGVRTLGVCEHLFVDLKAIAWRNNGRLMSPVFGFRVELVE